MDERKTGVYELNVDRLLLDQYNPRLYGESMQESQESIMAKIYNKEQLDELASSLDFNGYFTEEPIIVVPADPATFERITPENCNEFEYVVIEGNRRTTSVKLLLARPEGIVDEDFPIISEARRESLQFLPAIIYRRREDVDIYLSVRHITGNRKWNAFAKAKYIYEKVNKLNDEYGNISEAITILSNQIGDKSNVVRKYYVYYKVFLQIEEDVLNYSSRHIKDRFSLLEVALVSGNTTIAEYIGLPPFRRINLEDDLIKQSKIENLKDVTEWIFGKDEQGSGSLISDSRQISSLLKPILGNPEATETLKKYDDIELAYELTNGEEQMILGNLNKAAKYLNVTLPKVRKYMQNENFKGAMADVEYAIDNIKKLMQ